MNTFTSGLKSWKTTLIAVIMSVLLIMQEQTDLSKIQDWIFPALITALGIFMRDADKTSEKSGIVPLLIIAFISTFALVSCGVSDQYTVNTIPYADAIKANPGAVVMEQKDVTPIGGFQLEVGGTVITDQGEINIGNGGISTDVVIDLRSGK